MKFFPTILFVLFINIAAIAQTQDGGIYMPLEFQRAYEKGTRKKDGTVPASYWQNRSHYQIEATVNPATKLLEGKAKITYYNNSPDTLKSATFHVYHDYYKLNAKRSGFFGSTDQDHLEHKGMVIEHLIIEQDTIDISNRRQVTYRGTNYSVRLKNPLPSKSSMDIEIHWNYIIPGEGFERSGAIDSTSMFIGYWYPEMAVIDDIDGWDRITYDAATEFYHDFSDYEVSITVPDNFTVWASVDPNNPEEVYSPLIREQLDQARKSDKPINILTESDFRETASSTSTYKYNAENFPDFAFALSDHYLWDAQRYVDDVGEFFIQTAYPANHPEFASVLPTIGKSLDIFHNTFPVYPFPYQHFTIFNGLQGGGMEFPGMANNQEIPSDMVEEYYGIKMTDEEASLGLTLHEMAHMYFPFMMGIHEKKYAWMDEGFANFTGTFIDPFTPYENTDQRYLGSQSAVPVMVPSYEHAYSGLNAYTIGSAAYMALYKLLGREQFLEAMQAFMDEWKYKHPTPYDYMYTFDRVTGKDLDWFWMKWYFDWGYIDIGIEEVDGKNITVQNKGGRPVGFNILMTLEDGTIVEEEINPSVWKNAAQYQHDISSKSQPIVKVELIVPPFGDALADNNIWEASEM